MKMLSDVVREFRKDAPGENRMDQFVSKEFYDRVRRGEAQRQLYPPFADRSRWETAARSTYGRKVLESAEKIRETPPVPVTHQEFCRFGRDGNRSGYEGKYFERRNNLGKLALALCLSGDRERYLPPLLAYTEALLAEERWTVPAHCVWKDGVLQQPHQCDLFASESAVLAGLLVQILGPELEQAAPGMVSRLRAKAYAETLGSLFSPDSRKLNRWYTLVTNNWAIWVATNVLLSRICLEEDPEKLAETIQLLLRPVSRFLQHYGDDGYCDEGPTYFFKAGGMLFRFALQLEALVPGSMDRFWAEPKHRAIFDYPEQLWFGRRFASYSDASVSAFFPVFICGAIAEKCDLPGMAQLCRCGDFSSDKWGTGSYLRESLAMLFRFPARLPENPARKRPVSWYENRIALGRTGGFSVCLKAGNNKESHNHNDLGHFMLEDRDTPVILDAGCDKAYTKINFSEFRYTLWYTRGSGHNAPVINGIEQQPGETYSAALPRPEQLPDGTIRMSCDLANAYPAEAQLHSFQRTLTVGETSLTVEDKIESGNFREVRLHLICLGEPVRHGDAVSIGKVTLTTENLAVESIELQEPQFGSWPGPLYRIVLKGTNPNYRLFLKR